MEIGATPRAVVSPTTTPNPERTTKEAIATESAALAASAESVPATHTSELCGAETNANPAPSTGGKLGPECLPGDLGGSVADNLADDRKDGAD
jgi:hypothetical protein